MNFDQKEKVGLYDSEAIAPTQPNAVHNLIGMTALVMWPKLPISVKSDDKVTF